MHPLSGLSYVATTCSASAGYAGSLHVVARHSIDIKGRVATTLLASPNGVGDGPVIAGTAEFIAEQGDALIFRTVMSDSDRTVTVILTLQSASAGEIFATDGQDWLRAVAAVESLPEIAHSH